MAKRDSKTEGTFAILAALLVLFTTMLDPIISASLAIGMMIIFALWKFFKK